MKYRLEEAQQHVQRVQDASAEAQTNADAALDSSGWRETLQEYGRLL